MRLTKQTAYALRIVMHCAVHPGRVVPTAELAETLHITPANAVKTVRALIDAELLVSTRGRSGGVRLATSPDRLTVADIVRALEPTRVEADCIGFDVDCDLRALSPLNRALDDALEEFVSALDGHTIESLVRRQNARPKAGAADRPTVLQ